MDSLVGERNGESLARPLGCGEVGPIELPDQVIRTRSRTLPGGKWAALGGFAILGTSAILMASGPTASSGTSVEKVWQSQHDDERPAEVDNDHDDIYALKIEGLPNLGRSDAKVTLVVVSDYRAPTDHGRTIITSLRAAYGGDLRIVFKPYASTDASVPGLAGTCAASLQGELEAFDDEWSHAPSAARLDNDSVFRVARKLTLDMTRFASAMRRCETLVKASTAELAGYGFTDQTYFVNGKLVDPWGSGSVSTFETLIDRELARAKQRIAAGASADRYYQQFVLDVGKTTR